ncbi:hypothetical protein GCM10012289_19650 [Nonomuraea cavernae]|uniref:Uncharacterized protein n=1 Tax=Nonomuraea cavernae TaxID=2045107 RepID=A0A917YTM1_9ACTN|nr:hypothetical protein GCM10012289_19650 [Nonomuraea cavernae]
MAKRVGGWSHPTRAPEPCRAPEGWGLPACAPEACRGQGSKRGHSEDDQADRRGTPEQDQRTGPHRERGQDQNPGMLAEKTTATRRRRCVLTERGVTGQVRRAPAQRAVTEQVRREPAQSGVAAGARGVAQGARGRVSWSALAAWGGR